ncbi:PAS domain-containing protein [Geotalea uraniireducens]|uniref:Signal transduction histidine kinase n=1 Tax=Geotalea uraniireducens (strain Rf4) TaxID=351605 RepID=A5GER8_GEOUR|nr:PAS domain-containing protein [Geotalea uraniireducens]ABQ25923.1 signal transduction histidine kinase [Geotalea uraniireducens Rf4]
MKIRIRLKTALIVNYILVAVIPLLIIGLISLHFERRDLLRVISGKNMLLAETVAEEVDTFLQEPLNMLRQVGEVTHRERYLKGADFNVFIDSIVATYSFFESIYILDDKGRADHVGLLPGIKGRKAEYLGKDMAGEEFYKTARQKKGHWWTSTSLSRISGEPSLTLAVPVINGMVVGNLNLRALDKIIAPINRRKGIYAYIVNRDGRVIAHPDRTNVLQQLNVADLNIVKAGLAGTNGTYRYFFKGVERQGSVAVVRESGWLVVIAQNLDDTLAPVRRMEKIFLAGLLGSLLVALFNTIWSLELLLKPVSALINSTQKIAVGNYAIDNEPINIKEVGELAVHLQSMAGAVMSREEALREQNEELSMTEEELRQQVDEYLKSQDELLETNHALEALFKAAPLAIIAFDATGKVKMWNPAAERIFGWGRDEVVGNLYPLIPDGKMDEFQAYLDRALAGETLAGIELRRQKKSGLPIDISLDAAPLHNAKGEIAGVIALLADIGERKQAEKALWESDKRFTLFMDNLPARAYMKDVNGHYIYVNETLRRYFAERKIAWFGRRDDDIWPASTAALFKENDLFVLEQKRAVQVIEPVVEDDRLSYWLNSKFPIFNENGDSIITAGVTVDITERKQAEDALQAERARLFSLLQGLPAYVYLKAQDHTVRFANSYFRQNFGDPEGKKCYDIFHGNHGLCCECRTLHSLETQTTCKWEWTAGTGRTYEVYDYPFTDSDGSPLTLELGIDITERIAAEEQTKASLKEKEVLLKEIHHRVKNNLQVISSLLNLQSRHIHDQRDVDMFMDSQNRVKSMALIHENLYQTKNLARIDFAGYIRKLSANLFRSYGININAVNLNLNIADVSLGIDTAVPCGLMINELVSNSLKHGFPQGRKGSIDIELLTDYAGNHTLIVRDNGVGFPADLDFQSTESLGLQLVGTLTEQIGGSIVLDRENGTEFRINFKELKYKERV